MAKLNDYWWHGFGGSFQTEEDVIEFIMENLDISKFEDSYRDVVGFGEPNEMMKISVDDKIEVLSDFLYNLVKERAE